MRPAATSLGEAYLSLRPGVFLAAGEGRLVLFRRELAAEAESFGPPDAMKRAVLDRLATGPCPLADIVAGPGSDDVSAFVDALCRAGWLVTTVCEDGRELYVLQPLRALAPGPDVGPDDEVLSRFAVLRREDDGYVVESPLARARLLVRDPRVWALIGELTGPDPVASTPLRDRLLRDLRRAGLVVSASAEAGAEQDQWRPHDLWFHARSRMGSGGYVGFGFGRTEWAEPAPSRPDPFPGKAVDLYRPDLDALRETDRPLTTVVEERRTTRAHDDEFPITADQLGELLYRCARVRRSSPPAGADHLSRPYPAGGSAYELELYPVIRHARGLDPGMFHYDPHEHRLRLVRKPGAAVTRLLRTARYSAGMSTAPQVLIVVAARFGRLMRTYEELPYSLILKHVGGLYQTMYLVATAMGLAACGLGAGNALAFNEATGLDYLAEGSVGEFLLGGRTPG